MATTKVIGYLRVSTEDQHLGPEAQREAIERWCRANGGELVAVCTDLGVSGAAPMDQRPGLAEALALMTDRGAKVLLVAKRDRLARDIVVAALIERLVERGGGHIMAADGAGNGDGPEFQLMRGIMDVFAQYERALIRSRTKAAMAVKKTRGERIGSVPYGYRLAADGIHLEPDDDEQGVTALVRRLSAGGVSLRKIAAHLDAQGHPSRGGKGWHPETIRRITEAAA